VNAQGARPGRTPQTRGEWSLVAQTYNGYCVKCREKRDFEGEVKELANGSKAAQGQCPVCGTKMTRMLPKNAT
jgi:hypothetical protein